MKKIINLLSFLLIVNLIFLCTLLIKNNKNDNLLPISYAKTASHNNDNYNLILSILKDTNKKNLIQYADYINLKIIESIPNDEKNITYFILSLPENVSFIAIYKKIDSKNYKYENCIDNLSSINNFYKYKDFLVIEQTNSSVSGEFIENKYFQVFANKNNQYISVFKNNTYSEEILTDNDSTFKVVEYRSIDCLEGSVPRILCVTTITKYKNTSSYDSDNKFTEFDKITQKETYQWDVKAEQFTISKIEIVKQKKSS